MDWEDLFRKVILERGYEYYIVDAVELKKVSDDHIEAVVKGSEDYVVDIDIDDNEVIAMHCSCPYAIKGYNCKHMAAVLYQWQEYKNSSIETSDTNYSINEEDKLDYLINKANMEQMKGFLSEILKNDHALLVKFRQFINHFDININEYKKEIDHVVGPYLGRDNYIPYHQAYNFMCIMEDYIYQDVNRLIDNGDYLKAFELTGYLLLKMNSVVIDYTYDDTGTFDVLCFETWNKMLDVVDDDIEEIMYNWFINCLDKSEYDYMEDYIESILMQRFKSEKYLKDKLEFTEDIINTLISQPEDWVFDYEVEKWVVRHLEIMEELKYSLNDIYSYCKKYWQYSQVRDYYITLCVNHNKYSIAIELLNQALQTDATKLGCIVEYRTKLKELYKQINDEQAYHQQLWLLVTKDKPGDLDNYKELKSLYSNKEWIDIREEIFAATKNRHGIDVLYEEEKLYDRLLEYVIEHPGLSCLFKYEEVLKDQYPQELLQKYTEELNREAIQTANRRTYQEWVSILKRMTKITGGQEAVNNIITRWKILYRSRWALMEELKCLG